MENSNNFRLEATIAQWRADLENSAAMRANDIKELEAHLRDAIHSQQTQGVGEEAAFHTAIRQMGNGQELNREFAKTNWPHVWMDHVLWMAVGLIVAFLIRTSAFALGFTVKIMSVAWAGTIGFSAVAWVSYLSSLIVEFGIWFILWRLVVRENAWIERCARWSVRHPMLPVLGVLALNLNLTAGWEWINKTLALASANGAAMSSAQLSGAMDYWFAAFTYTREVLYLLGFTCLAVRYVRINEGTLFPARLSSRNVRNEIPPADSVGIWRERALWIVAAPVLYSMVILPLTFISTLVAAMVSTVLPRNAVILGTLELVLHWVGYGALLAGLYWLGAHGARWGAWLKESIARKPVARTTGIAVCLAAFSHLSIIALDHFCAWVLHCDLPGVFQVFHQVHSDPQYQSFFSQATAISYAIWFRVLPVFLILWLARKRAGLPLKDVLVFKRNIS